MSRGPRKLAVVGGLVALVATLVVAGVVSATRQRAERRQALHALVESADALRQRNDATFAAVNAQLEQVDLGHVATASQLASAEGLKAGRLALARHHELLAERERLLDESVAQSTAFLAGLPHGRARDDALFGQAVAPPDLGEVRRRLSAALAANEKAVRAVLDWAGRHQRNLHARGDTLLIDDRSLIPELDDLQYTVNDSAKAVQEALAKAGKLDAQSATALDSLRRDADR